MTLAEFEYNYRVATGLNFINLAWITEHNPKDYKAKVFYFIKLEGYIELLKDAHYPSNVTEYKKNTTITKYGRFHPMTGIYSDLTKKLIEIIFGINGYIVNDESDVPSEIDNDTVYLVPNGSVYDVWTGDDNNIATKQSFQYYFLESVREDLPETGVENVYVLRPLDEEKNTYEVFKWNTDTNKYEYDPRLVIINNTIIQYLLTEDGEYILTNDGERIKL